MNFAVIALSVPHTDVLRISVSTNTRTEASASSSGVSADARFIDKWHIKTRQAHACVCGVRGLCWANGRGRCYK